MTSIKRIHDFPNHSPARYFISHPQYPRRVWHGWGTGQLARGVGAAGGGNDGAFAAFCGGDGESGAAVFESSGHADAVAAIAADRAECENARFGGQ